MNVIEDRVFLRSGGRPDDVFWNEGEYMNTDPKASIRDKACHIKTKLFNRVYSNRLFVFSLALSPILGHLMYAGMPNLARHGHDSCLQVVEEGQGQRDSLVKPERFSSGHLSSQ